MSYEMVRLDEVSDIISGQSPPSSSYNDSGDGTPFFQGKADFNKLYPTVRYWCTEPKKLAKPNDILLSVRAPVGPTNICNIDATIGRGLAAIRSHNKLDYMFLLYYLRSFEHILANKGTGSTFSAITMKDVRAIPIPLPPIETQRSIVEILDKAQELIDKRKEQIKEMDSLVQSLFYDMFGDPVSNPMGWEVKKLGEVVYLQRGYDLPVSSRNPNGSIPVYGSNGILSFHDVHKILEPGIVTGRSGSIGFVEYVNQPYWPLNTTLFSKITFDNNYIYLAYLLTFFNLKRFCNGTGVPTLNRNIVHKEFVYNIPIELQNTFAERVQKIEQQKKYMTSSLKELEDNFNCLMQKAFKGELV